MKDIIDGHIEMIKVLKEAPLKEIIKTVVFMVSLGALYYFSILIFG